TPQLPVNTTPAVGVPPVLDPASTTTPRLPHSAPKAHGSAIGSPPGGVAKGSAGTSSSRSMPPGGLIGGAPGLGLGQPGPGSAPVRRVNPVGGVIGGGGAGTAPAGSAGSRPGARRSM